MRQCISIAYHLDRIFISDQRKLFSYSINSKQFDEIQQPGNPQQNSRNTFYVLYGKLYVLSEGMKDNSVSFFGKEQQQLQPAPFQFKKAEQERIFNICEYQTGNIALCGSNGIRIINTESQEVQHFYYSKNISSFYTDREGMLWTTTLQDGIFIIPSPELIRIDVNHSSLSESNLTAVAVNDKHIITGSHKGRVSFIEKNNFNIQELPTEVPTISTKVIHQYQDSIWISHGPLTVLDKNGNQKNFSFYNARDFCIMDDSLYYVLPDINGRTALKDVYAGQNNKYGIVNPSGGRAVCAIHAEHTVYYALNKGLFCYQNGTLKELLFKGQSVFVTSLSVQENKVYAASINYGLLVISNGKIIQAQNESNSSLPNELKFVHASNHYIWTCSNNQLFRLSSDLSETAVFTQSHGINAKDINGITTDDGFVYLATNKGLLLFPQDMPWKNNIRPSIQLRSVKVDSKPVSMHSLITLPFRHQSFSVEFSSVSFKSKGQYRIAYRMPGLDSTWHEISASNRVITYQSIPPGDYTFEIRAINESGLAGDIVTLKIHTEYPVWQQWWFYVIASLISVAVLGFIAYLRIRYIQKKAENEKKMISFQLTALKAQMNPHFMYNALNSIQALILKQDIKNSNLYLSKFSHLMRKILDASGKDRISIQEEVEILELYLSLEQLRFGNDFEYLIQISESLDSFHQMIPPILLQPYVENAIKHGLLHKKGNKKLTIRFEINEQLKCIIEDNGVGRKKAGEIRDRMKIRHQSFSTQATSDRVALLSHFTEAQYTITTEDLYDKDTACGTRVTILIPLTEGN